MLTHLCSANMQTVAMQDAPDPTQGIVVQPGKGGTHCAQGPADSVQDPSPQVPVPGEPPR